MNIDFNNAESTYTTAPYNMSGLNTSITKYIGGVLRSFVKDSRSTVVCEEVKKDKGIKKSNVAQDIMLEDYKDVLFTEISQYRRINMIHSELHNAYTIACNKLALSADEGNRTLLNHKKAPMNHSSYNRRITIGIMYIMAKTQGFYKVVRASAVTHRKLQISKVVTPPIPD
jgi:hypothetical protein